MEIREISLLAGISGRADLPPHPNPLPRQWPMGGGGGCSRGAGARRLALGGRLVGKRAAVDDGDPVMLVVTAAPAWTAEGAASIFEMSRSAAPQRGDF